MSTEEQTKTETAEVNVEETTPKKKTAARKTATRKTTEKAATAKKTTTRRTSTRAKKAAANTAEAQQTAPVDAADAKPLENETEPVTQPISTLETEIAPAQSSNVADVADTEEAEKAAIEAKKKIEEAAKLIAMKLAEKKEARDREEKANEAERKADEVKLQNGKNKTQQQPQQQPSQPQQTATTDTQVQPIQAAQQQPKVQNQQQQQPQKQPRTPRRQQNLPPTKIHNILDLTAAPTKGVLLNEQQIWQTSTEELEIRHRYMEEVLTAVLDYDVVLSDTNIWIELNVEHRGGGNNGKVEARLMFERQLEFISKLTKHRGARFMMMGETYEEIDRFATMLDPQNHQEADWNDSQVCLNAAARLAKRLILQQQRDNRLRIEGIEAESHHAAFADPAIIRKVVELFAAGRKVLLITNDASVAIRSLGICDDLQRFNSISNEEWDATYAPIRPMVFTFDELKLLDNYTKQYHYLHKELGCEWMEDVEKNIKREALLPLEINTEAFRPGDKHRMDGIAIDSDKQQTGQQKKQGQQQKQKSQPAKQQQKQQQSKQQQKQNGAAQQQQQPAVQQPSQQQQAKEKQQNATEEVKATEPLDAQQVAQPEPNGATPSPATATTDSVEADTSTTTDERSEEKKPKSHSRRGGNRNRKKNADKPTEQTSSAEIA